VRPKDVDERDPGELECAKIDAELGNDCLIRVVTEEKRGDWTLCEWESRHKCRVQIVEQVVFRLQQRDFLKVT
jgi:hypothetical protein